jgi:hypothetical protein
MTDWADEIAKEIDMDWPSVTAALRKARQDALADAISALNDFADMSNMMGEGQAGKALRLAATSIEVLKDKQP